jgi:hypothetical protein
MAQTEGTYAGEFLASEANGTLSRETVTVVSGAGVVPAGRIVAVYTGGGSSGKWTNFATGGADGAGTAAGVLYAEVDATSADAVGVVIRRDAEVVSARLTAANSAHKAAGITGLASLGIIAR